MNPRPTTKEPWRHVPPGPTAGHSPVLTWLSLVGLLPSIARLRFTRQPPVYHPLSLGTRGTRNLPQAMTQTNKEILWTKLVGVWISAATPTAELSVAVRGQPTLG
jgi:hypothetical protein